MSFLWSNYCSVSSSRITHGTVFSIQQVFIVSWWRMASLILDSANLTIKVS